MKPVTGNRTSRTAKKVSIQLALDGHSFSVTGLPASGTPAVSEACEALRGGEGVQTDSANGAPAEHPEATSRPATVVEVLTPRTLLVPGELFGPDRAAALLAAGGLPALADDEIVWSAPRAETVAVMAAAREAVAQVRAALGSVEFTSPLLPLPAADAPSMRIFRVPGLLYLTVCDRGLRLAEVFPAMSDEDMLCLLERLEERFALKSLVLHLAGDSARKLSKLLKNRFREVLCES